MLTRRQILFQIVPVAGATAGICVQMRPRPDRLEAGQVWRRGDEVFIVETRYPGYSWEGIEQVTCGLYVGDGLCMFWRTCDEDVLFEWTYVGTIWELAGVQR